MALEHNAGVAIFQGEDKRITVRLQDQDGDPVNLSQASQIAVYFKNADGTPLIKKMSASQVVPVNAGGGIFTVTVLADDTALMALGDNQSIEIRVTISGSVTYAQVQNAISVLPSLFPGA